MDLLYSVQIAECHCSRYTAMYIFTSPCLSLLLSYPKNKTKKNQTNLIIKKNSSVEFEVFLFDFADLSCRPVEEGNEMSDHLGWVR